MNMKKHWLKSLAVAAVVAMASANASADILAGVTAKGQHGLMDVIMPVAGMTTAEFKHPGGQLAATYTAQCYASKVEGQLADQALVNVEICVRSAAGGCAAVLSPTDAGAPFCAAGEMPRITSVTGLATLPPGNYRIMVRAQTQHQPRAHAWMGPRSLVVSH